MRSPLTAASLVLLLGAACGRSSPPPAPKTTTGSTGQLVTGTGSGTGGHGAATSTAGSGSGSPGASSAGAATTTTGGGSTGSAASTGGSSTGNTIHAPGVPTGLTAVAGVRSVELSWVPPVDTGGGVAIVAYYVVIDPPVAPLHLGNVTSATVTGLADGTTYTFTVCALNAEAQGAYSAPVSATTPALPAAPGGLQASPRDQGADLSWTAPASDLPVTGYVVSVLPPAASAHVDVTGTTAAVSGLVNGTAYTFTVAAVSDVGQGPDSAGVQVTPADTTPPAAITDLRAERLDGSRVRLSWTAPGDDGASGTAARYLIRAGRDGACPLTAATFDQGEALDASAVTPRPGGSAESAVLMLSGPGEPCLAVEAEDEADNAGPLSNVAAPPPRPLDLAAGLGTLTARAVGWTSVGGAAQELRLAPATGHCPDADALPSPRVIALPAPGPAGAPEQASVGGLTPGAAYCLALRVADAEGNASFSDVLAFSAADTTPPASVVLSADAPGPRAVTLRWAAPGDDGDQGTAAAYDLRLTAGPGCAAAFDFAVATPLPGLAAPAAAGSPESYAATGLPPGTHLCFALRAADAAGNASTSPVLELDTAADVTPPAAPDLAAPAPGEVSSTAALLRWTAPADDGSDPATGPAAAYELRSLPAPGADCAGLGAADFAAATPAAAPTPGAPGSAESASVALVPADAPRCFALRALDAAGNASPPSAWRYARDSVAPARVADLAAAATSETSARLTFTAPGDDGAEGTAAAYDLRAAPGPCPADADAFFAAAAPLAAPAPQGGGSAEAIDLAGLDRAVGRCFALRASDEVPNAGPVSNLAFLPPSPRAQLQALRDAIAAGPGPAVALPGLQVTGAVVTYLKPGVGGAATGSADGPGYFVQAPGADGPALLFAMDPGPLAVGDVVDATVNSGAWLGCSAPPCTAANALYAATAAQVARAGSAALPAPQDLSAADLSAGAGANWSLESELAALTGTLGALSGAGPGFGAGRLVTAGTDSANLQLRAPRSVLYGLDLAAGCSVSLATPLWRTDAVIDAAAWSAADLGVSGCPAFAVASASPADGETGVSEAAPLKLAFTRPVAAASLTVQASDGPCSGALQLSRDGFASCLALAAPAPLTAFGTAAEVAPRAALLPSTAYALKVKGGAGGVTTASGVALAADATFSFTTRAAAGACDSPAQVVISQVYGGGGNASAIWRNDFIELHNRGSAPASLAGWSVQYASAAGSSWTTTALPAVSIPAGGYFLVQEASSGAVGVALPTADASGSINLAAGAGKVALVAATAALSGACPSGGPLVDLVGYGATASCFEGAGPAPAGSNALSLLRGGAGRCSDSQSSAGDFTAQGAAPVLSSASAGAACECQGAPAPVENETGLPAEADYCAVQFPTADLTAGADQPLPVVYGRLYEAGVTEAAGPAAGVVAELGYGPAGSDPRAGAGWSFVPASYNAACANCGNDDEYGAALPAISTPGSYRYAFRFSLDQGQHWTWCDRDGAGANPGLDFSLSAAPLLTITP